MDTSPEYIKMCEKAEEIQGVKPVQDTSIYWPEPLIFMNNTGDWFAVANSKFGGPVNTTWLPRQDQLQEMVWTENPHELLDRFDMFREQFEGKFTFEQLWLAFVMQEKYGKTWNGEDWKKGEGK